MDKYSSRNSPVSWWTIFISFELAARNGRQPHPENLVYIIHHLYIMC
jgi:hypothetical protein